MNRFILLIAFLLPTFASGQNVGVSSSPAFVPQKTLDVDGDARISGQVGIGVLSPSHKLHVVGGVRTTAGFIANDGTANTPSYRFNSGGSMGMFRAGTNELGLSTNSTERIRISSTGNVGINEPSPVNRLQVNGNGRFGTSANNFVYIASGATTGAGGLEIFTSGNVAYIRYHDPWVAWRDIALNDAGGNVGIGTVSPTRKLDVNGDVRVRSLSSDVPFPRMVNPEPDGTLVADIQVLWGNIDSDGWINAGSTGGFTTAGVTTGVRRINFIKQFAMRPTCICTQHYPASGSNWFPNAGTGGNTRDNCLTVRVEQSRVDFKTGDSSGNASNRSFGFICIGAVSP